MYGTLGVAAASNIPGGRSSAAGWTDASGHRWIFGGYGADSRSDTVQGYLNDLWQFDPATLKWTWMGGSNTFSCTSSSCGQPGVYGTFQKPAPGNIPGGRSGAVSWVDSNGNFWLYGGKGIDGAGQNVILDDLWKFDPTTLNWTWMGGSNVIYVVVGSQAAVYGTKSVPAVGNNPGSQSGAGGWTDSNGDLWLFGDGNLWKYSISLNQWAWMSGTGAKPCPVVPTIGYPTCLSQPGFYGTRGLPDAASSPPGSNPTATWTDRSGNFWLFGGYASDVTGEDAGLIDGYVNVLWDFNPTTGSWAWMGGDYATSNCSAQYFSPITYFVCDGNQGVLGSVPDAANIPSARAGAVSWTDKNGNFWLFGGTITDFYDRTGYMNDLWEYQPSMSTFPSAATPIFSLKSATYATGGPLIIANGMPNAKIYYTIDGTTPTTSSMLYNGPISVTSTETVKAIAVAPGYRNSSVASASYIVPNVPTPASPVLSLAPGTYTTVQKLTISEATPGATIYYTTDGTTPVPTSPIYSGPITLTSPETITALAVISISGDSILYGVDFPGGGGAKLSTIAQAAYTINLPHVEAPVFSASGGTYYSSQTITISDGTPGATIYYTLNGTTPTTNSVRYTNAISITYSQTLQAIAVADGYANSSVATAAYTISPPQAFALGSSASSLSIPSGSQGTATLTVTPQNGFNSPVSFACSSGLPAGVTCSFSPMTVTPSGSAVTTQLTVITSARTAGLRRLDSRPFLSVTMLAGALSFFGLRRRRLKLMLSVVICFSGLILVSGCGSGSHGDAGSSSPTPTNSVVTITATSGNIQQKVLLALTVN